MSYVGVPPFGQTVRTITEVTATAGQTTFTPSGGYLPGYIDVSLNGIALSSADFTATNGTTVTLTAAAAVGDEFRCVAYWPVSLMDTYRKGEVDTLLATKMTASGPAFSAILSTTQTVAYATFTKLALSSEEFDVGSNYDTSTYRFTPTVPGYYSVQAAFQSITTTNIVGDSYLSLYKNGARFKEGKQYTPASTQMSGVVSALVYLNGSTDYIELYVATFGQNISQQISADVYRTFFQAFLARSAT
jgi:hypothetical protein